MCGTSLSGCALTPAQAQNLRIEAETKPASGDLKIIEDAEASGGKAVSIGREYQPLLIAPIPASGDEFTIWARYKDGAIQAKSSAGGKQTELKWSYDKPKTLTWKSLGRYTREQLGDTLIIIRSGGGGAGAVLDAIVFATDKDYDPNGDATQTAQTAPAKTDDIAADNANLGEAAQVGLGLKDAPDGTLFEAENYANAGVIEAAGASGGKAVKSDNDWQPLVSIPLPEGEAWKVWVRRRGGPFTIKTKSGDRWNWNKPDKFEWQETDVFGRDELGGKFLTIGRNDGGKKDDSPQIDAVVLTPAVKRDLPADKPDAKLAPVKVEASVDWSRPAGTLSPLQWGINDDQVITARSADAGYQSALKALDAPLVRVHNAGMMDAWTRADTRDWDVAKIKAAFAGSTGYGDAPLMMNLTWAPGWMGGKKVLNTAQEDELAALWARLVVIMRDEVKRPVAYWEITNEWESTYEKAGKLDDLWRLYNKCAAAMRREDPKTKLGGMAFTWAKPVWIEGFLRNCDDVQFVSWHNYGTGDLYESNADIYKKVESNVGGNARGAMALVKQYDKGRNLQTFLTETNVKYTWDPYERRHQNAVGSVFHALVVKEMAQSGVTGTLLWQQRGQAYGSLVGGDNKTFPSYTLYGWGPKYLSGTMASATTSDAAQLEVLAVTNQAGRKAVLLINKAPRTLQVGAASKLLPNAKSAERIDAEAVGAKVAVGELSLPGYSLTLLRD